MLQDNALSLVMDSYLQLVLHGAVVLLVGLLVGVPYDLAITGKKEQVVFAWRVAHSGLSMGGTTMIAISSTLAVLKFDSVINALVIWPLVASGYSFCLALPYGAWVGQRGLDSRKPLQNRLVYAGNIVGAVGSLIGVLALIVGCLKTLLVE